MIRVIDDWYEKFKFDDWDGPNTGRSIPTVNDIDSFCETFYQDIIRQVTHGQGLYFGYECERFTTNDIPINTFDLDKYYQYNKEYKSDNPRNPETKDRRLQRLLEGLMGIDETEKLQKRLKHFKSLRQSNGTIINPASKM